MATADGGHFRLRDFLKVWTALELLALVVIYGDKFQGFD
jgi:hypothetical protein